MRRRCAHRQSRWPAVLRQRAPSARIVLIADNDVFTGYSYDYLLPSPATWHRVLKVIEEALASERRQVLVQGPFVLDLVERTIVGPAGEARLTAKLFGLLALLMRNAGQYVSRHQIMQEIWNTSYLDDTRTLDVHISWLRGIDRAGAQGSRSTCAPSAALATSFQRCADAASGQERHARSPAASPERTIAGGNYTKRT